MAKDKLEAQIEEEKAVLLSVCTSNTTLERVMEYLEELGLIKMDFLGIRNLSIIDNVVKNIQILSY